MRLLAAVLEDAAASGVDHTVVGTSSGIELSGITHDSRNVGPGDLFACISGLTFDGHRFAEGAVAAGAAGLVVERELDLAVPQIVVDSVRGVLGRLSAAVYGHPSRALRMVGITGTNGKTTTATLLASILQSADMATSVLGTLHGPRTTPEAPELQRRLADAVDAGVTHFVMEVSSHALDQGRVDGVEFDVGVFCNLTPDHLDYHGDMDAYFEAKRSLFQPALTSVGVINADDPYGAKLLADPAIEMVAYRSADASDVTLEPAATNFSWRSQQVALGLPGTVNVSNAIAAATAASVLGLDDQTIARGLSSAPPVPGRVEPVETACAADVIVDYAHTPDAIEQLVAMARAIASGRVVIVFGCGGDRDAVKRAPMGVAAAGADVVIVTSDNPRSENPAMIAEAAAAGVRTRGVTPHVELDRRSAIAHALEQATAGDLVLIAGKGHETTQTIGDIATPFDDRVVAAEEAERLAHAGCSTGRDGR